MEPMATLLIRLLAALAGLIVSARTHLTVAAPGVHASIPVLGVVALAVVLLLAAAVLVLLRSLARGGWHGARPRMVAL
jgi:hypothetical protein